MVEEKDLKKEQKENEVDEIVEDAVPIDNEKDVDSVLEKSIQESDAEISSTEKIEEIWKDLTREEKDIIVKQNTELRDQGKTKIEAASIVYEDYLKRKSIN
jgi:hypothetical protein